MLNNEVKPSAFDIRNSVFDITIFRLFLNLIIATLFMFL
jgi:hypothetical protein